MLFSLLAYAAIACDPVEWEVAVTYPTEPSAPTYDDIAPLAVVYNLLGPTEVALRSADGSPIEGSVHTIDHVPGGEVYDDLARAQILRLVPTSRLAPGAYQWLVGNGVDDRTVRVAFDTQRGGGPDLQGPVDVELSAGQLEQGEDSCGTYRYRSMEVRYTIPEAAWAIETLITVHSAAGPNGPVSDDALAWRPVEAIMQPIAFSADADATEVCVAVRAWGLGPLLDGQSDFACIDLSGDTDEPGDTDAPEPDDDLASCGCSSVKPSMAALWVSLAALLVARRRRRVLA